MLWTSRETNMPHHFLFLFPLFFIHLFLLPLNLNATDIFPGSSLHASNPNQTWSSPNDAFSLLFLPITPTTFSLCIAYGGSIPIWKPANETDANSSFHFLSDGNLRLINGSGVVLWQSNTAHLGITRASLDNSGNFILKNDSVSLWHSFEHLTDTLVQSQNFTVKSVLTSGSYSFRLNQTGFMNLMWNNRINYWSFGANSSVNVNLTNPSLSIQSSGTLSLFNPTLSKSVIMAYSSDFGEEVAFKFLRLDSDGNLRIYSATQGNKNAIVRWTAVSDQCQVFGYCGNMGICTYNDDYDPTCFCPSENFVPVDPSDGRKGCKRKVEIKDCQGNAAILQMNNTLFLTYYPETVTEVFTLGISACRLNCLYGSPCVASSILAQDKGLCYIKSSDFLSGHQSPTIPGSSFVKVCSPIEPNPPPPSELSGNGSDWKLHVWIVAVLAGIAALLGFVLLGAVFWWFCCRNNPKLGGVPTQYTLLEYASGAPVHFSYKVLQRATNGFKEKLGAGGFGAVYKGSLFDKTVVAVKQLEGIEQGEKQFRMEVATISSTHHLNLVRLIGFCSEGRHRLLVYEFMKNGSLDLFLFRGKEDSGKVLNWEQRFKVALGTARGITYLHEECRDCIIHCDIKPENILLDENFNSKVSDFGLAKLISPNDQRYRTLTSVRGTRGYLAPEWIANLPITSKSDVYSFGMVLLEIASGRRNFEVSVETNGKKFSFWAYEEFEKGNVINIVEKRLHDQFNMEQMMRVLQVSFWCIQEQPLHRPMMGKVVQMLEGIMHIEKPPPLKATREDLAGGSSICVSTSSGASTLATSGANPSSTSSSHKPFASGTSPESPASSLLHSGL